MDLHGYMDMYGISSRYPHVHKAKRIYGHPTDTWWISVCPGDVFYQYPEDIHHGRTMDMAVLPLYVSFDIEINIFYIKEEQCSVNPIYDICL